MLAFVKRGVGRPRTLATTGLVNVPCIEAVDRQSARSPTFPHRPAGPRPEAISNYRYYECRTIHGLARNEP